MKLNKILLFFDEYNELLKNQMNSLEKSCSMMNQMGIIPKFNTSAMPCPCSRCKA